MEGAFRYDATYLHEMLDASMPAFLKFGLFQKMSTHCDRVASDAWFAARLAAVMSEEYGPCAQLTVDMALRAGMDPKIIAALVRGDLDQAGVDAAWAIAMALRLHPMHPSQRRLPWTRRRSTASVVSFRSHC